IQAILNPLGTAGLQAYLDDILLYHNGMREHLDRLAQVFQAHREGGIRLKPSKTRGNRLPGPHSVSVIFGCRKFNPILSYRRFVLNTDSSALLQIKNLKPQTSMLIRWTEELAALDFEVKHSPGQLNTNADGLSRREEFMPPPTDQEERKQTECISIVEPEEELLLDVDVVMDGAPQVTLPRPNLDIAQWLQSQLADTVLVEVQEWLRRKEMPSKAGPFEI
ncbi:MAG: hypothetical protein GY696_12290, partial [Gammaproteobacteria bacterium]|nr:hypothetical protein [Gammaproteobacteria bacterium]